MGAPFEFTNDPQNQFYLGRVYAYDLLTGDLSYQLDNPAPGEPSRGLKTDDFFGISLAIDNELLVIGVDGNSIEDVAHVFDEVSGEPLYAFENPNVPFPFHYGPVDIAGATIVVGDISNSDAARFAGAVYVGNVPEPKSLCIWTLLGLCSTLVGLRTLQKVNASAVAI